MQKKERGEEAYQFGFFFFGQLGHVPFDMFVDDIFEWWTLWFEQVQQKVRILLVYALAYFIG